MARSILWKLYAVLILISTILVAANKSLSIEHIIPHIIQFIGILGLFGYAFSKPFGSLLFWRIYTVFVITIMGLAIIYMLNVYFSDPSFYGSGVVFVALLFVLPNYYALWAYSFKSHSLWSKKA